MNPDSPKNEDKDQVNSPETSDEASSGKTPTVRGKGKIPDPPPVRLSTEYMEVLWEEAERLGALDHLTSKERYAFRQFAVVKAAIDRARSLWGLVRLKGSNLPPPFVRIRSEDDYRWLLYGRLLREKSPKVYEDLLTSIAPIVQDQLREMEVVRELSTRTQTEDLLESAVDTGGDDDEAWFREWARRPR